MSVLGWVDCFGIGMGETWGKAKNRRKTIRLRVPPKFQPTPAAIRGCRMCHFHAYPSSPPTGVPFCCDPATGLTILALPLPTGNPLLRKSLMLSAKPPYAA